MKIPFLNKKTSWILLGLIICFGFFLRSYHVSSWLHFELDQARDARVIDTALEGDVFDLPLLGPKAGGTFLRLPPTFYEVQYLSGFVFGGGPVGITILPLLLSVATLFTFFLLAQRFFSVPLSLTLTLLASTSLYLVLYGRFAWNPNLIPFFMVTGFYALLRSVDTGEKHREKWFIAAAFFLTLATHFHFLAFLLVPAITITFLLLVRPRFLWRSWVIAFALVAFLFLPVALNEQATGGKNTQQFFAAVNEKSEGNSHNLAEKGIKVGSEIALYSLVIMTGYEGATFPRIDFHDWRPWWICNEKCDEGKWYGVSAALVLVAEIFSLLFLWRRETQSAKKQFLLLCGLWIGFSFLLFIPLAFDIVPRFFLLLAPLCFLLFGFLFLALTSWDKGKRCRGVVLGGVVGGLIISNLFFIQARFHELGAAATVNIKNAPDRILKEKIRVTLEQQEKIVDFMQSRSQEHNYPVYMFSEPQYRRALKYLMQRRGMEEAVLGFDGIYRQGVYFLVFRSQSDFEADLQKYRVSYDVGAFTPFGTLTAIELFPHENAILGERQDFSIPKPNDSRAPERYTWREFFRGDAAVDKEEEVPEEEAL